MLELPRGELQDPSCKRLCSYRWAFLAWWFREGLLKESCKFLTAQLRLDQRGLRSSLHSTPHLCILMQGHACPRRGSFLLHTKASQFTVSCPTLVDIWNLKDKQMLYKESLNQRDQGGEQHVGGLGISKASGLEEQRKFNKTGMWSSKGKPAREVRKGFITASVFCELTGCTVQSAVHTLFYWNYRGYVTCPKSC